MKYLKTFENYSTDITEDIAVDLLPKLEEIKAEKERITGGSDSLASKAAEYERLALEMDFADKQLAVAMASLESARNQALRQQLYLMTMILISLIHSSPIKL